MTWGTTGNAEEIQNAQAEGGSCVWTLTHGRPGCRPSLPPAPFLATYSHRGGGIAASLPISRKAELCSVILVRKHVDRHRLMDRVGPGRPRPHRLVEMLTRTTAQAGLLWPQLGTSLGNPEVMVSKQQRPPLENSRSSQI